MANIHIRTSIVLMLISIITLGKVNYAGLGMGLLTHSYNSSHNTQEGVLSQTLGEELIFNYTDSFSESTFLLSWSSLNLSIYNEFTINFMIEGDTSSKAGITITIMIDSTEIDFLIEKIHQHPYTYSLSRAFYFENPTIDDFNLSITFAGQATYGNSGSLIILANSSISHLNSVNLAEFEQILDVSPSSLLFEGNMVGLREISAYTALNFSLNSSYLVDLDISFQASDFQSFTNELILLSNSQELARSSFDEDMLNEINFQFEVQEGFVFLQLLFQIEVSSDIIGISNISITARAFENAFSQDIFYQFEWIDIVDETINLDVLKPSSEQNNHVLNISLYCSFEGTTILDGIDYDLYMGIQKVVSGIISVAQQSADIQLIQELTYTDSYQEDLTIEFSAENTGSGTIILYNSSSVGIQNIDHIDNETYTKVLEEESTFKTPTYGSISKNYYDVIFVENASLSFKMEFLMELTASESAFQSIALSIYVDDVAITTKSISEEGDVHIIFDVQLNEEFNEIKFTLNILGRGSTITFKNMRFTLLQNTEESPNPLSPEEGIDIPFFKVPKNIFLGIFVLFDCWLVMGIILRIYKGRKFRKKQLTENDEFILEIVQLSQD